MEHLDDNFKNGREGLDLIQLVADLRMELRGSFHTYHRSGFNGWDVLDDGTVKPDLPQRAVVWHQFTAFVQRWLYFEVLREILGHLPEFDLRDFIREDKGGEPKQWITTEKLPGYLERWLEHEKQHPNKQRQLQTQLVLDRSRSWVSQYCAVVDRSETPRWPIDEKVALSIMVLGETLTSGTIRFQRKTQFEFRGWVNHEDSFPGWGCSSVILKQFEKNNVCPHKVFMLRGRLQNNTIALLFASRLLPTDSPGVLHDKCDAKGCKPARSYHQLGGYRKTHHTRCNRRQCKPIGPDTHKLSRIIDKDQIPLLQYNQAKGAVEVIKKTSKTRYVVFSHVWADGYGNPDYNLLNQCVLDHFLDLLTDVKDNRTTANFWIDTLAVPVEDIYQSQRKKAIQSMSRVYTEAQCTIVLDAGLMSVSKREGYVHPAMSITVSGWLTRLWTLQEAVLSRKLLFNFSDGVISMEKLERLFPHTVELHSCLEYASRMYCPCIMKGVSREVTSKFVAAAWKAVQGRTTEHLQHETLALATLFNIDLDGFADLGDMEVSNRELDLDGRMERLLSLLAFHNPCPIPPGMIFLPGPRLVGKGYRWAPRTWLSACAVDPPDPLVVKAPEATLVAEGLQVNFPGFLLNGSRTFTGLFTKAEESHFPTNLSLSEWYRMRRADEEAEQIDHRDLAVIAPRLPILYPKEIALLVAVKKRSQTILTVEILHRVWISAESDPENIKKFRDAFLAANDDERLWGEKLPAEQRWWVDGLEEAVKDEGWKSFLLQFVRPGRRW